MSKSRFPTSSILEMARARNIAVHSDYAGFHILGDPDGARCCLAKGGAREEAQRTTSYMDLSRWGSPALVPGLEPLPAKNGRVTCRVDFERPAPDVLKTITEVLDLLAARLSAAPPPAPSPAEGALVAASL